MSSRSSLPSPPTITWIDVRVLLFPTCLAELVRPEAAKAAEEVLERAGCDVEVRPGAVCCGQPAWNSGHVKEARRVALGTLDALDDDRRVIVCSGSCSTMMREYWPQLFDGTADQERAREVSERVHEFSSFVADQLGDEIVRAHAPAGTTCSYHDSCHMMRALGISDAPRRLLSRVENLELRELAATERCCGFGGTFSLRYPELAAAMADEKVDDAADRDADFLVSSDIGCLMHICGRAEARGHHLEGRYIAEMLI
jgi:L-lactate dehydrogenase complex protein LldE